MTQQDTAKTRIPASLRVIWRALRIWYDDWFNLFIQNFLVNFAWVTIILGPPMLFGLYEIGNELAHGRSNGVGELLHAAKRHFLTSWLWALINVIVLLIIGVNVVFYWRLGQSWAIVLVSFFLFAGFFWLAMQLYAIPYYMELENPALRLAFKNSALTVLAAPGYSLILLLYTTFLLLLSYLFVLPLFLAAPALSVVTNNCAVVERLRAFGVKKE